MIIRNSFWIFSLLSLLIFGPYMSCFASKSSGRTSVSHVIEPIWQNTSVHSLAISSNYHYLRINSTDVILVEEGIKKAEFHFNHSFYGLTAYNRTLFIPYASWWGNVSAVSFENFSAPSVLSTISHYSTGGLSSIISYDYYIYVACYEWGFPIFDFSNLTHPRKVGQVPLSTWHSYRIYRVFDYGIFIGDHQSGIFDLSNDPVHPLKLWSFGGKPGITSGRVLGRPAISDQFFLLNYEWHVVSGHKETKMFYFIPRESATLCGQAFNITYSPDHQYKHFALLEENILIVSDDNNTLTLFEITKRNELELLTSIYLGSTGSIKDLYPLTKRNELYIVDGVNGLLKLSIVVTRKETSSGLPGFTWMTFSLINGCLIVLLKKYKRHYRLRAET